MDIVAVVVFVTLWGGGMLALAYFGAYRPWWDKRRSHRELPRLLEERGFRNFESRSIGSIGTFGGVVRGHPVFVEAECGQVKVWLARDHELELESSAPVVKPKEGWRAFDFANKAPNKRFKLRYARPDIAACFERPSPALDRLAVSLRSMRRGYLNLSGSTIEHRPLNERNPEYIPVGGFETWFSALIDFVAAIDDLLPDSSGRPMEYRLCTSCGAVGYRDPDSQGFQSCVECRSDV